MRGRRTEPEYLRRLKGLVRNGTIKVKEVEGAGQPARLVGEAVRLRDQDVQASGRVDAYDEVWCVFDRDEHPGFDEACARAEREGLHVAASNPCFELWLLLHFRDHRSHQSRHAVQRLLEAETGRSGKSLGFDPTLASVEAAIQRAAALDQEAEALGAPRRNPSTEVYRLAGQILGHSAVPLGIADP